MKKKQTKIAQIKEKLIIIVSVIFLTTLIVRAIDNISSFLPAMLVRESQKEICPEDMVFVPSPEGGFCIDKYENSPGPNCPFQNPQSPRETKENLDTPECKPISAPGKLPWTFISQNQAQLACAKAKKRLPTNKEWYLASLGTPDKNSDWGKDDCHIAKNWDFQPGKTGSGKNCVSSFGAYDMIGNVWEWVDEVIIDGYYENKRRLPERGYIKEVDDRGIPTQTDSEFPDPNYNEDYFWISFEGTRGFLRGGYWDNSSRAGIYSIYLYYQPSSSGPGVGFRCAK